MCGDDWTDAKQRELDSYIEDLTAEIKADIYGQNGSIESDIDAMILAAFQKGLDVVLSGAGFYDMPFYHGQIVNHSTLGQVAFLFSKGDKAFVETSDGPQMIALDGLTPVAENVEKQGATNVIVIRDFLKSRADRSDAE